MLRPRQVCCNYISKLRQACNSPGQTKQVEITQDFSSSSYFFSSAFILKGVALNSLRFLFDGQRINDDQTPKDVSLYLHSQFDFLVAPLHFILSVVWLSSFQTLYSAHSWTTNTSTFCLEFLVINQSAFLIKNKRIKIF